MMIRITRGTHFHAKLRAYKIYIDDICYGKIKCGETMSFQVENGRHIVYAKVDWYRSNKLDVNVGTSVVSLEVGSAMDKISLWWGWGTLFMQLVYGTFLSHKYLWLREKDVK